MEQEKIERINALARKAKGEGLTEAEKTEQAALRKEFLAEVKTSIQAEMANTYVLLPDGTKLPYKEYAQSYKKYEEEKQQPEPDQPTV